MYSKQLKVVVRIEIAGAAGKTRGLFNDYRNPQDFNRKKRNYTVR